MLLSKQLAAALPQTLMNHIQDSFFIPQLNGFPMEKKSSDQWWQEDDGADSGNAKQVIPTHGTPEIMTVDGRPPEKVRIAAGILAIILGGFGVHKFYLGYTKQGVIMFLMAIPGFMLVFPLFVTMIIAISEGVIYLTKSDQSFYDTYEANQKVWF